jgi:hypothetical protein
VVISNSLGSTNSLGAALTVYALADTQLVQNGGFETGDFTYWDESGNSVFDNVSGDALFVHSGLFGAEFGPVGSPGYISQTVPTTPGGQYLFSFWLDSPDGDGPNELTAVWNGYTVSDQTNLPGFGWTNYQFTVTATGSYSTLELGFRDDTSFLGLDDVSLKPLLNPTGQPVITQQPAAQTIAVAGTAATLTVTATGLPPLTYLWQSNNVSIPNATNSSLTFASVVPANAATYNVIVSNSAGSTASSNDSLIVLTGNVALVTFDDLGSSNIAVPEGYANLTWSNFACVDSLTTAPNPSGYIVGTISQPNVAYNLFGSPATLSSPMPFDFLSATFTAAWNNDLRLEIRGYSTNGLVYDNAFTLSATNPTALNVNCVGVTNMEFISSGGSPVSNYPDSGFEFVMDNASIIASPLPPPTNDTCATAIVVSGDAFTNIQSTIGATSTGDPTPTCVSGFTNGVWYDYTPPDDGWMGVDANGSSYPAALAIYSGACGALTPVACNPAGPVTVTGGTKYFILVGSTGAVDGTLIFHLYFSSPTMGPPLILSSPASITVAAGQSASFSVSAEGAQPLTYFWKRNGATVAATSQGTFTANNVQLSDSGEQYSCVVSNALGTTASAPATLTVNVLGQLVRNGGFETGDFTDWTLFGNTGNTAVNSTFVHGGQYGAELGPVGSLGYLSQTLGTTPGQLYLLSLWLDSPTSLTPNEFSVAWNGTGLFDQLNLGPFGWTNLQFEVTAVSTNSVLEIGFRDDPAFLGLDDISVLPLVTALENPRLSGAQILFDWNAIPGSLYQLQYNTNLLQTNWLALGSVITASNYVMTTSETITSNTPVFYRVVFVP